jgi:hypothetical protein
MLIDQQLKMPLSEQRRVELLAEKSELQSGLISQATAVRYFAELQANIDYADRRLAEIEGTGDYKFGLSFVLGDHLVFGDAQAQERKSLVRWRRENVTEQLFMLEGQFPGTRNNYWHPPGLYGNSPDYLQQMSNIAGDGLAAMAGLAGTAPPGILPGERVAESEWARGAPLVANTGYLGGYGPYTGPVIFRVPASGATSSEMKEIEDYVKGANMALNGGALSRTGRVRTSGGLRKAARDAIDVERERAAAAGAPYIGDVGHVPDTTWMGVPSPYLWSDMSPRINKSLGAQARQYPLGFKPTEFIFERPK